VMSVMDYFLSTGLASLKYEEISENKSRAG
jgi:hypothetical protein